jgi:hypothetical protein
MDLILGIRVVRFPANNAGIMGARWRDRYIKAADVAEIVVVAKIAGHTTQQRKDLRAEAGGLRWHEG